MRGTGGAPAVARAVGGAGRGAAGPGGRSLHGARRGTGVPGGPRGARPGMGAARGRYRRGRLHLVRHRVRRAGSGRGDPHHRGGGPGHPGSWRQREPAPGRLRAGLPGRGAAAAQHRGGQRAALTSGPVTAGGPGRPLAEALVPGRHTCRMSDAHEVPEADQYQWLEDVTGETALDWVRERNAETLGTLSGSARFEDLRTELRQVLDSDDRIPYPRRRGAYLYNFWQDAAHPRGLWRRTTLAEYRRPLPDWDVLLDIDALGKHEGENWVFQGATMLRPGGYQRALVQLSRGGADASVVREFDVPGRRFIEDGFTVAEAKTDA